MPDPRHHRLCPVAGSRQGAGARHAGSLGAGGGGQPYEVRLVTFAEMNEAGHRALQPSGRFRPMRKAVWRCSSRGRSCCMWRSAMPGCCRTRRTPGRARSRGCSRRRARWSRRSSSARWPRMRSATRPGTRNGWPCWRSACGGGWASFRSGWAMPDWLDGAFSAGDLLMVHVLQRLGRTGMLEEWPNLAAYVARGEARPAFSGPSPPSWRSSPAGRRPGSSSGLPRQDGVDAADEGGELGDPVAQELLGLGDADVALVVDQAGLNWM